MVTEALTAVERLSVLGVEADIVVATSPDLLFRAAQARQGREPAEAWILDTVFDPEARLPLLTVIDGHPHTLAFLGATLGVRTTDLGVTRFGQGGDLESVYRWHGIDADSLVGAALDLVRAPAGGGL
jgi:pyruvate dehydrogenase E1 component